MVPFSKLFRRQVVFCRSALSGEGIGQEPVICQQVQLIHQHLAIEIHQDDVRTQPAVAGGRGFILNNAFDLTT